MENQERHIYQLGNEHKKKLKWQKGWPYIIPLIVWVTLYGYIVKIHHTDKILLGMYIAGSVAWLLRVVFDIRKSNQRIENSRIEINDTGIGLYIGNELQSSIQFADVVAVKRNKNGIKIKRKNDPFFNFFISGSYEQIDEMESLISNKVTIV